VDLGFPLKAWLLQRLHKEEAHTKKEATATKQNKTKQIPLLCVHHACKQVYMTHSPFVNVSSSRVHFSLSLSHSHSRSWIPESNQEAQNIKLRKQAQSFTREGRTTVVALLISLQRS